MKLSNRNQNLYYFNNSVRWLVRILYNTQLNTFRDLPQAMVCSNHVFCHKFWCTKVTCFERKNLVGNLGSEKVLELFPGLPLESHPPPPANLK